MRDLKLSDEFLEPSVLPCFFGRFNYLTKLARRLSVFLIYFV